MANNHHMYRRIFRLLLTCLFAGMAFGADTAAEVKQADGQNQERRIIEHQITDATGVDCNYVAAYDENGMRHIAVIGTILYADGQNDHTDLGTYQNREFAYAKCGKWQDAVEDHWQRAKGAQSLKK